VCELPRALTTGEGIKCFLGLKGLRSTPHFESKVEFLPLPLKPFNNEMRERQMGEIKREHPDQQEQCFECRMSYEPPSA
jgi:hypothetical protein